MLKYLVFENPKWDYRSFDVEKDAAFAEKKLGKTFDAFDPDLTRFRNHGGRLLLYHGWNDPSISPLNTINYYEKVVATVRKNGGAQDADARTQEFARLFMVPGMMHCGGGPGPNTFDMVAALEAMGRAEATARAHRRVALHKRGGRSHAAAVCVPEVGVVLGFRQHGRCR